MSLSYEEAVKKATGPGQFLEIAPVEIDGIEMKVWKNFPATTPEIFEASRQFADREFLAFSGERMTYEEHYQRVATLAHRLLDSYAIEKGDRIAIAMRNYPEWSVAFWAITSIGAVVVPLNAWWTSDELSYGLRDSGSVMLFADQERLQRVQAIDDDLPVKTVVAVRCDSVPEGVVEFESLIDGGDDTATLPDVDVQAEDLATLFYTSGTTGFPKGTMGTHRNLCSAAVYIPFAGTLALLRMGGSLDDLAAMAQQQQVCLLTTPLFHVTACQGTLLNMLNSGGKIVLMYKWDADEAVRLMEEEHVTFFGGVPTMVWQILDAQKKQRRDLSKVINIGYGGAAAPPELFRRLTSVFPTAGPSTGWGITETSSTITTLAGEDYARKPDSVGRPLPVYDLKVVDGNGNELPVGAVGELWVRGPQVVKGYWNKPEATAESFTEGWFHTGDIGKVDEEGFVYILDRIKDMIIRAGENVYCSEVEGALLEYPGVKAVCVFGTPHEVLGEEVAAAVQLDESSKVGEQELRDFVAKKLAKFKVPARIWFRSEPFPLGATGKVQKREVRQHYLE